MIRTVSLTRVVITVILISSFNLHCSNDKEIVNSEKNKEVISEEDANYLLKSIELEKGKLNPDNPQNDTQTILSNYIMELNQINRDTNEKVSKIEPVEFSSFIELRERDNVSRLRNKLKDYWSIKKHHYDLMDELLKKYRSQLRYGKEETERLDGTAVKYIEQLEEGYVLNLDKFYDFILQNHESMSFTEQQIYIENPDLVDELNRIWSDVSKWSSALTSAQETGGKVMTDAVKELKKQRNIK